MAKPRLTVEALVIDAGRVLLVRQGERRAGDWELPGGKVKAGESIAAAVQREVLEETGVAVVAVGVVAMFYVADEDTHDLVLRCRMTGANPPKPRPPEITAAEWFPVDRLPEPMRPFTANCIRQLHPISAALAIQPIDASRWLGS